jgi:flagellar protein FliO/FliZ
MGYRMKFPAKFDGVERGPEVGVPIGCLAEAYRPTGRMSDLRLKQTDEMPMPEEGRAAGVAALPPRIVLHQLLLHARRHLQLLLALVLSAFLTAWLFTADALAATPTATTPRTPTGEQTPLNLPDDVGTTGGGSSSSGGLARTIVGLLIVLAVIYGISWVLKNLKKAREDDASGVGLASTATLPLGPGRAVHLVRAGNEWILLGVTEGGISALRTYTDAEARAAGFPIDEDDDEFRPASKPGTPAAGAFVERLRDFTVRR